MAEGSGGERKDPSAPGWYTDPWSATGEGERYFDGKRWGTSEKPLARHTVAVREPGPPRRERFRRVVVPIAILVLLVAGYWGWSKLQSDSGGGDGEAASAPRRDQPPPSSEEASRPLGIPAPVPAGTGQFELLEQQKGSVAPVAFDPCRPIHYVVNVAGAPSDGLAMIHDAVAEVSDATGLKFVDDGTTTEAPTKEREPFLPTRYDKTRWAPVLIAWPDESSYPDLAGYIAGEGSPVAVYAAHDQLVYVSGQVVLDGKQLSEAQVPDRARAKAVVLHELGHLVGLDHTNDRTQLMFSESQFDVRDFGDGDRRGLALLGQQRCFPKV